MDGIQREGTPELVEHQGLKVYRLAFRHYRPVFLSAWRALALLDLEPPLPFAMKILLALVFTAAESGEAPLRLARVAFIAS
jgi:hypothetical protein